MKKYFKKTIDNFPIWEYYKGKVTHFEKRGEKMPKAVYGNIEKERTQMGLNKTELSEKLGITRRHYNNYIAGNTPIPSTILIKLSQLFNCSVDYLLS